MKALECQNLTKWFYERDRTLDGTRGLSRVLRKLLGRRKKIEAVKDVSLSVGRGEIFGILGPNGSGKSTLIRMISTLLIPDSGQISVFGRDALRRPRDVRRLMHRVSVDAAFFKKLSAWENLVYSARLYGLGARTVRERLPALMEAVRLKEKNFKKPMENLSRGMQQKVAIVRALVTRPELLLLDEPTTGLDPVSKKHVADFILRVRDESQTAIVLTTHDMAEADKLCDMVAIIHKGEFVAVDTPEGLKRRVNGNGKEKVTLEDVFFHITGAELKKEEKEEEDEEEQ